MSAAVTLSAGTTVRDAAIFLAQAGTRLAPVVSSKGEFLGAFGEADIHRALSEATGGFHTPEEFRTGVPFLGGRLPDPIVTAFARIAWTPVRSLARAVPPVASRDPVLASVEAMRREGLPAIPVVDDGRPVGILTADALTLRLLEAALTAGA